MQAGFNPINNDILRGKYKKIIKNHTLPVSFFPVEIGASSQTFQQYIKIGCMSKKWWGTARDFGRTDGFRQQKRRPE
jgi:hypothetical protein